MNYRKAKVNWGTLANFPEISVNRFGSINPKHVDFSTSRAFFLTQFDEEICNDVLSKSFLAHLRSSKVRIRLYLHELIFHYLKYYTTTIYVENGEKIRSLLENLKILGIIVFLETNQPINLRFKSLDGGQDRMVQATAMSSGSNVGSIMLLFEDLQNTDTRVLFTGDCRLTLNDLKANPDLHNADGSVKKLSKLYIDTMYLIEDAKELPSRRCVIDELLGIIEELAKGNKTMHFDIWTHDKLRHLIFLQRVVQAFGLGIHVPPNLMCFLESIPKMKGIVHSDCKPSDRFHSDCETLDNQNCGNGLEWGIDFEVMSVTLGCNFVYHYELPRHKVIGEDENQWCKKRTQVYRTSETEVRGIYSCHLSRYEIGRFINYFGINLESVIPLRRSADMKQTEMEILFEMACADGALEPPHFQCEFPSYCYDFTNGGSSAYEVKQNVEYSH